MNAATELAVAYIEAWNETDAVQRRSLIEKAFTRDVSYVDPIMNGDGHDGVDALIAGVHQRFPGFRFKLMDGVDGHADYLRFSWELGPEGTEAPIQGTDFAVVEAGRLARITGFLDRVPAE
ncbi:nuclear transport factor 2 family protein [Mesorhizobium sp. ZC-5]|uniref:nuclear transport factor 2 family protein n=1 Tax=Mesorhizobium sp. ZC-5 TaxID=2986066 RepID=UPI0021E91398|nr:nuclear transport factor 2 family protein [Mesorhizobium sp. ZC-5]MCV3239523.1 nuclear transport factor 2 family protein [Mesorhizobium sp. ZC-5]